MNLISARKDFWSDTELAVRDKVKEVDLVGETPSTNISNANFLSALSGEKVLVLVHGYNNEPEDVHNAYATLERRITANVTGTAAYDRIIGYIWPGGDDALDYFAAKKRANALARRFGIWLNKMSQHEATVDVMGHSMGARVIFKALKTIDSRIVRNTITMAASIDNESVQLDEEFHHSTRRTENVFVFHSKHDPVLKYAYSAAEFDTALGLSGPEDPNEIISHASPNDPDTPNIFVVNCKNHIRKHGAYKRTKCIFTYFAAFLGGTIPQQYETL